MPALNFEGAVVFDDALVQLHRGSRTYPLSALIELARADVFAGLDAHGAIEGLSPRRVCWVDLGSIDGVALTITDGSSLADGRLSLIHI